MADNNTTSHTVVNNETKKCIPCESFDKKSILSKADVERELSSSSSTTTKNNNNNNDATPPLLVWSLNSSGDKLVKKFTAKNFQAAIHFFNEVALIAEREGHHPDLHLTSYREVEVVLYTHSVGGVTMNDLMLARMIDREVKPEYSPKWLKDNPEVL